MPLNIVRDDLVNRREDAIVLPSNERLVIDGGAGLAVAKAAGLGKVRRACQAIGRCETGSAVATPAFDLPSKWLVHAVAPMWSGSPEEAEALGDAYRASLEIAHDRGCESIALPLLGAGAFGCPAHVSLAIALTAISDSLEHADLQVVLVLYDKRAVAAGLDFLGELESLIDDAYVEERSEPTHSAVMPAPLDAPAPSAAQPALPRLRHRLLPHRDRRYGSERASGGGASVDEPLPEDCSPAAFSTQASLDARLEALDESFSETLLALIDESGMTDAQVYRRANMSRQHFSKIRSNVGYRPTKATVLALCIALELDLPTTRDLLERAGFALSHASKFDVIVEYFIERGDYDPFKINETLFYFDQPLLG